MFTTAIHNIYHYFKTFQYLSIFQNVPPSNNQNQDKYPPTLLDISWQQTSCPLIEAEGLLKQAKKICNPIQQILILAYTFLYLCTYVLLNSQGYTLTLLPAPKHNCCKYFCLHIFCLHASSQVYNLTKASGVIKQSHGQK